MKVSKSTACTLKELVPRKIPQLRFLIGKNIQVGGPIGQTRKHCCGNIVSYQFFAMFSRVGKHLETLVRNIGKHQMFLNSLGNIFASREVNFVSATMFPSVGKQGNI